MQRILFTLLASLATSAALSAQDMLAIEWNGDVYDIDSTTGVGTFVTASGAVKPNAMALRSDGKVFVAGEGSGSNTPVYEIDSVTRTATFVVNVPILSIRALAFDGSDVLFAINDPSPTSTGIDDLHMIDLTTGAAPLIGSTNLWGIQAMTWGVDSFWGWECGSGSGTGLGLITIDPATATCNDVDPNTNGLCLDVQALTTDPAGVLFGANSELFVVDIASGALSLVGSGGYTDVRGLEFIGAAGPSIYCTAKATSISGCLPTIGGPAATASLAGGTGSYDVTCGPLPGGPNVGVLSYTTLGPLATPLQNAFGWQCIPTGPGYFIVLPPQLSGGTAGTCTGAYVFDFGFYLTTGTDPALVSGVSVDMQVFYRDPANIGTANLSDALALTLVP